MNILNDYKILSKDLPPFFKAFPKEIEENKEYEINGIKFKVNEEFFSDFTNKNQTKIQLNPAFLKATLLALSKSNNVAGLQKSDNGETNYVLTEIINEEDDKIYATAYNPKTGMIKGCKKKKFGNKIENPSTIGGTGGDGTEIWFTLLVALSMDKKIGGDFHNDVVLIADEIEACIANSISAIKNGKFTELDEIKGIYRMMDSINAGLLNSYIPFAIQNNTSSPGAITNSQIKSAVFLPNAEIQGEFKVFVEQEVVKKNLTVNESKKIYAMNLQLTESEQKLVPDDVDSLKLSTYAKQILDAVKYTPQRNFMLRGPAGTGKSTDAKAIAAALGIPYRYYTCNEGTDEMDIITKMIPNTSRLNNDGLSMDKLQNIYNSLLFDPATAVSEITGEYPDNITAEEAFGVIVNKLTQQKQNEDKDFVMVASQIVEGVKRPSVVEIQEAMLIGKPGVLPALNALLDDNETVTLIDGSIIKKDPNTIFIFTTNTDYKGCKPINESVLSRMDLIIDQTGLTAREMVKRLFDDEIKKYITNNGMDEVKAKNAAEKMAKAVVELNNYCQEYAISGGVCGYREFRNWFYRYLVTKNMREAATNTIISHITSDESIQIEIKQQLFTKLPDED